MLDINYHEFNSCHGIDGNLLPQKRKCERKESISLPSIRVLNCQQIYLQSTQLFYTISKKKKNEIKTFFPLAFPDLQRIRVRHGYVNFAMLAKHLNSKLTNK